METKSVVQSKLMWFGALVAVLPDLWAVLSPVLTPVFGEVQVGRINTFIGAGIMVLRMFTSQPVAVRKHPADGEGGA